jgi:D-tyrosyl-tRNA(Tyr) deacylase
MPQRASFAAIGQSAKRSTSTTVPVFGSTATESCFSGQDRCTCATTQAWPGLLAGVI